MSDLDRSIGDPSERLMSRPYRAQIGGIALTQGFALGYNVAPHSGLPESLYVAPAPFGASGIALCCARPIRGFRNRFCVAPHSGLPESLHVAPAPFGASGIASCRARPIRGFRNRFMSRPPHSGLPESLHVAPAPFGASGIASCRARPIRGFRTRFQVGKTPTACEQAGQVGVRGGLHPDGSSGPFGVRGPVWLVRSS